MEGHYFSSRGFDSLPQKVRHGFEDLLFAGKIQARTLDEHALRIVAEELTDAATYGYFFDILWDLELSTVKNWKGFLVTQIKNAAKKAAEKPYQPRPPPPSAQRRMQQQAASSAAAPAAAPAAPPPGKAAAAPAGTASGDGKLLVLHRDHKDGKYIIVAKEGAGARRGAEAAAAAGGGGKAGSGAKGGAADGAPSSPAGRTSMESVARIPQYPGAGHTHGDAAEAQGALHPPGQPPEPFAPPGTIPGHFSPSLYSHGPGEEGGAFPPHLAPQGLFPGQHPHAHALGGAYGQSLPPAYGAFLGHQQPPARPEEEEDLSGALLELCLGGGSQQAPPPHAGLMPPHLQQPSSPYSAAPLQGAGAPSSYFSGSYGQTPPPDQMPGLGGVGMDDQHLQQAYSGAPTMSLQSFPPLGAHLAQGQAAGRNSYAAALGKQQPRLPDTLLDGQPSDGEQQLGEGDEDDPEYRRAIEASLAESSRQRVARVASGYPPSMSADGSAAADAGAEADSDAASALTAAVGLANATGEYNCFLNTIIQCMWHCTHFRAYLEQFPPGTFGARHPVVEALTGLFHALSAAEREWQPGRKRRVVNPTALREALDALPGHRFRIGEMNDASEVLGAVYDCLRDVPRLVHAQYGTPVVEDFFGLKMWEHVKCGACGVVSHHVRSHVEWFHIVAATALRDVAAALPGHGFGNLLRQLDAQHVKRCDKELGGCERAIQPIKTIERTPNVFCVQLAWEADVAAEEIAGTMAAVEEVVRLEDVYAGSNFLPTHGAVYRLGAMVCYYGQHYHAFIFKPDANQWLLFDDATVLTIGGWGEVVRRCAAGRIQPAVLFYMHHDASDVPDLLLMTQQGAAVEALLADVE